MVAAPATLKWIDSTSEEIRSQAVFSKILRGVRVGVAQVWEGRSFELPAERGVVDVGCLRALVDRLIRDGGYRKMSALDLSLQFS